ncbi:hypothetical protein A8A54_19060 [Brucella pseudogrignonensis]|uniref:acetyl-CoA carboxylase biotin carboxyl carrier protein n=1 Tax=Brucella pseudogrignonensis TaxID=419475 RepID=UPI0007DA714D|nr:biotin/lipoyl-containing protein [Brucella pseudogrignonensis]ANG98709.1 hypothetical protein A8A54_19060 [Brucella pseudogrignonensis]
MTQIDRIEALIRLVGQNGVTQLDVTESEFSLSITATGDGASASPAAQTPAAAPDTPADPVTAPLSGTFYAAASPGAAPFVTVGDIVAAGQALCIIEAMKSLNEVAAPHAGRVTRCLLNDGDGVEAGQPLFVIAQA